MIEGPEIVDRKERFGDPEADTIIGKKHKGIVVTINDRMTGMLKMKKVSGKEAAPVAEAIIHLPEEWKPLIPLLRTMEKSSPIIGQ